MRRDIQHSKKYWIDKDAEGIEFFHIHAGVFNCDYLKTSVHINAPVNHNTKGSFCNNREYIKFCNNHLSNIIVYANKTYLNDHSTLIDNLLPIHEII